MSEHKNNKPESRPTLQLPNLNTFRAENETDRKNIISRYLSRLLYRPAGMLDELLIPLEVNGCYLSSGCFIVAAISIDHIPPENSFSSLDDIFNLLSEHIADELSDKCIPTVAEVDGQMIAIANYPRMRLSEISGSSAIERSFSDTCDSIISSCEKELGLDLCAFVSCMFEGVEMLPYFYERIQESRRYRMYLGSRASGMPKTISVWDQDCQPEDCLKRMDTLIQVIRDCKWDEYYPIVEAIFSDLLMSAPYSIPFLNMRLQAYITELVHRLSQQYIFSFTVEQESAMSMKLCSALNANELYTVFIETMEDILIKLTNRYSTETPSIVSAAQEYIKDNIKDVNLSPTMIADNLGVGRSTLSSVFSISLGEHLSDYIHRIRLALAEELMVSTNYTILEISEKAGYGSITTMHRAFQRYHSTSPAKYRSFLLSSLDDEKKKEYELSIGNSDYKLSE